jgi:hypothetical protein
MWGKFPTRANSICLPGRRDPPLTGTLYHRWRDLADGSSESRHPLNCAFTPSVPGPIESYKGTITKLGLDLGATTRGVIVWLFS